MKLALTFVALGLFAVGCTTNHNTRPVSAAAATAPGATSGVTDIAPTPPATAYAAGGYAAAPMPTAGAYDPASVSSVPVQQVALETTVTPSAPAARDAEDRGSAYKVRRGDTLYSIARASYGDGKQWKRIAAANPGVSPASLKVGQTLAIP